MLTCLGFCLGVTDLVLCVFICLRNCYIMLPGDFVGGCSVFYCEFASCRVSCLGLYLLCLSYWGLGCYFWVWRFDCYGCNCWCFL